MLKTWLEIFDTIREKIAALFELRKHNPDYAQIALLQEMDDDDFVRKVRETQQNAGKRSLNGIRNEE